jgi:hypothetical protein
MKSVFRCIHPLVWVSAMLFAAVDLVLPGHIGIEDIFPTGQAGPCSVPVFLIFVPMEFGFLLGVLLSVGRYWLAAEKRKSEVQDSRLR